MQTAYQTVDSIIKRKFSSKRTQCPVCSTRRGFAPFIEDEGHGYCHACAKLITDRSHNSFFSPSTFLSGKKKITLPPKLVPGDVVATSLLKAHSLPFFQQLAAVTSAECCKRWSLGRIGNAAVYWYIDIYGRVRNGKRVTYTGLNRSKDNRSAPSYLYSSVDGYGSCLFGEHQLSTDGLRSPSDTKKVIGLVESEKTAIIMSHHAPDIIWLAAGGSSMISFDKASVLEGRRVAVIFDHDAAGENGGKLAHARLSQAGALPYIVSMRKYYGPSFNGADIADLILSRKEANV